MKKQVKVYLIATLMSIALLGTGITAAYFAASVTGEANTNVTVTTTEGAKLEFIPGADLTIDATMLNFQEGLENLSFESTPKVKLTVEGDYTTEYYVYFNITTNEFVYTSDKAELILVIKDPEGTEITQIDGLEYITGESQNGFDITTKTGLFAVSVPEEITSLTGEETETWSFELFFINLDTNQNDNAGKSFAGEVIMQKDVYLSNRILIDNYEDEIGEEVNLATAITYIEEKETPDFSLTATTDEGMYATSENAGTAYYFRGATEDNYVEFAGMLWRIIRIDDEGNIKLILFNEDASATSYAAIGTTSYGDIDYNESTAKTVVDEWYDNNLSANYEKFLEITNYCIDMTLASRSDYSISYGDMYANINYDDLIALGFDFSSGYVYSTVSRLYSANDIASPSIECYGENQQYYVGLISADEISLAGGVVEASNLSTYSNYLYYLYSGFSYATLSPLTTVEADSIYIIQNMDIDRYGNVTGGFDVIFAMSGTGQIIEYVETSSLSILPTITLKSNVAYYMGDGTLSNPYKIAEY